MLYGWRTRRKKARFRELTKAILDTPPVPVRAAPWSIVSMVANEDVEMYLLALKSFYGRIACGNVLAIIDRDMPGQLRDILEQHIPGIDLQILEDIDTGPCQRGGTWERLLYVLDRSRLEYVIQLDADTLTTGPLEEVRACVLAGRAFTLGTWNGLRVVSIAEASAYAQTINFDHIQILVERTLNNLPGATELKYVRGSSGFAGFARGGFDRRMIEEFHLAMSKFFGRRFREWGTEQVASNFAIANSPNPVILPYPDYAVFGPELEARNARFLHFIGSYRFERDIYAQLAFRFVKSLLENNAEYSSTIK